MATTMLYGMASGPQVQDIATFRKSHTDEDLIVIPEVRLKRKLTDQLYLYILVVVLFASLTFLIYTMVYSDISRLTHGQDSCGNYCGSKNRDTPIGPQASCPRLDYSNEPLYELGECVSKCHNYRKEYLNYCQDELNERIDLLEEMRRGAGIIAALTIIGLCLTVGMLFLYRYCMAIVVWIILIGSVVGFVAVTVLFWLMALYSNNQYKSIKQVFVVIFTIISVVLIGVLLCMFKRIKLVIQLFNESIKVMFGVPMILFEPVLTLVANVIMVFVFVIIYLSLASAGIANETTISYEPNAVMFFTFFYQGFLFLWFTQIIIGCQHMAISGAASEYYFTRDKDSLTLIGPIYRSLYNVVRYHLGTIIVGSIIIVLVTIVRVLIRPLIKSFLLRAAFNCCLASVERFLKFLSKNAFFMTAMHGQPFMKSGKRAVHVLAANALSVIAVNSVGEIVLFMTKLLICLITLFVGILIKNTSITSGFFNIVIVVSVVITAVITDCVFTAFETTVDTILLCYCEDSLMNDGKETPYYYKSENLMQFIEESKKNLKPSQLR